MEKDFIELLNLIGWKITNNGTRKQLITTHKAKSEPVVLSIDWPGNMSIHQFKSNVEYLWNNFSVDEYVENCRMCYKDIPPYKDLIADGEILKAKYGDLFELISYLDNVFSQYREDRM